MALLRMIRVYLKELVGMDWQKDQSFKSGDKVIFIGEQKCGVGYVSSASPRLLKKGKLYVVAESRSGMALHVSLQGLEENLFDANWFVAA